MVNFNLIVVKILMDGLTVDKDVGFDTKESAEDCHLGIQMRCEWDESMVYRD